MIRQNQKGLDRNRKINKGLERNQRRIMQELEKDHKRISKESEMNSKWLGKDQKETGNDGKGNSNEKKDQEE